MRHFCGIQFNFFHKKDFLDFVKENSTDETSDVKLLSTVNAQFISLYHNDSTFKKYIDNSYAMFDGQIPLFFAKLLRKVDWRAEKITGSEMIYDICELSGSNNIKVFLLGASVENNCSALKYAKDRFQAEISGYSPDDIKLERDCIFAKIRDYRPAILFVGFGAPKQEKWILENLKELEDLDVRLIVGCGGSIDFLSGALNRAPKWAHNLGLESFYRFFQQPSFARVKRIIISFNFFKYITK